MSKNSRREFLRGAALCPVAGLALLGKSASQPGPEDDITYHYYRFRKSVYSYEQAKRAAIGAAKAHCEDIVICGKDDKYYRLNWGPSLERPRRWDWYGGVANDKSRATEFRRRSRLGGDLWVIVVFYSLVSRDDREVRRVRAYWKQTWVKWNKKYKKYEEQHDEPTR